MRIAFGAPPIALRPAVGRFVSILAEALAAAHSVGVLHKDVKPSNVLIWHDTEGRTRARLTDFGVGAVTEHERLAAAGLRAAPAGESPRTRFDVVVVGGGTSSNPTHVGKTEFNESWGAGNECTARICAAGRSSTTRPTEPAQVFSGWVSGTSAVVAVSAMIAPSQ